VNRRGDALQPHAVDYLEGLLEGFVAYDGDWVMTYMNAAAERLLNRRRDDVLGKTWHEAFPHAVGNPVDAMYQRVMDTRQPERTEYFYEHYGRWLEISASAVSSGGVAVYFRDVTERRRAEEALREADRRKDEFLAMLAHELRNPLAPIRNALHLLRVSGAGPVAAEARDVMERQLTQLIRLVDDLLEVSRISRGKIELRRAPVDLAGVVASAVETSRPIIDGARHHLEIRLPPAPLHVEGDFVRLSQVVANLLNNAAKYTDPSGRIAVLLQREGAEAVIRVRDNGVGLAPELLPRIFDMFAQADRARAGGGLGIGLALAKMLVELHGGRIEAKSDGPGQGSAFTVRLPLKLTTQPCAC
jgi:PAS domain S-box-containing protein